MIELADGDTFIEAPNPFTAPSVSPETSQR